MLKLNRVNAENTGVSGEDQSLKGWKLGKASGERAVSSQPTPPASGSGWKVFLYLGIR